MPVASSKSKALKIVLWSATGLIGLMITTVAVFLIYLGLNDYKPPFIEPIAMSNTTLPDTITTRKLEMYTWNIGYCGLGRKMDFFYENGQMTRPEKEYYEQCRDGVFYQLTTLNKLDFILLQEVDQHSERSYNDDQVKRFKATFNDYEATFALNYKVPFIPLPVTSPMGKVESGIMTLGRYKPLECKRIQFPSAYGWPKKLFMLDRCLILSRYRVNNGKQLVIINTHNSAYADAADMREKELSVLRKIILDEFNKGNYVVAGGDWNQNPLTYSPDSIRDGNKAKSISPGIASDFLPSGFTWAFDPQHPTNRDVDKPYEKGITPTGIIDFFILSPNIKLLTVNTLPTNFEFADHQPVGMILELQE
jgi:endonuclease/exonuclease/phosphatase family metal-dependent hydrolase